MDIARVKAEVTAIPDFPLPGILFRDLFPVFRKPELVELIIAHLVSHIVTKHERVNVIVGLDARGFLFGPILAMRLGAAFVPVRKQGKLPGNCVRVTYEKEYGADVFEMQAGSIAAGDNVVIVDDLLATGGTMKAACELVAQCGGIVKECLCVIELVDLKGTSVLSAPFYSMIQY